VKARPILFSSPMVRALLEGSKTQTRRVVNPQPSPCDHEQYNRYNGRVVPTEFFRDEDGSYACSICGNMAMDDMRCRYGVPGDLLWVRETLWVVGEGFDYAADGELAAEINDTNAGLWARYGHEDGPDIHPTKIPSIFMPRWASRLTLRLTDVRVQRLTAISEDDAEAEGLLIFNEDGNLYYSGTAPDQDNWFKQPELWFCDDPYAAYLALWDSINGEGACAKDPWVWALTFDVIKANVDHVLKEAA